METGTEEFKTIICLKKSCFQKFFSQLCFHIENQHTILDISILLISFLSLDLESAKNFCVFGTHYDLLEEKKFS